MTKTRHPSQQTVIVSEVELPGILAAIRRLNGEATVSRLPGCPTRVRLTVRWAGATKRTVKAQAVIA